MQMYACVTGMETNQIQIMKHVNVLMYISKT